MLLVETGRRRNERHSTSTRRHPRRCLAALSAVTDPNPTPQRQADLRVYLVECLAAPVKHTVAERTRSLGETREDGDIRQTRGRFTTRRRRRASEQEGPAAQVQQSLAKAIVEFKRNELGHKRAVDRRRRTVGAAAQQSFFVDEGGGRSSTRSRRGRRTRRSVRTLCEHGDRASAST